MALELNLGGIYDDEEAPAAAAAPPSAPAPLDPNPPAKMAPAAKVLDPYTVGNLGSIYSEPAAPKKEKPHAPKAESYKDARAATESPDVDSYFKTVQSVAGIPTKDKMAYVNRFLEVPGVDVSHLKEAPLSGAYQLAKLAEESGYQVVFQSGKRDGGGTSYHDRGEAVDVRFKKKLSNGQLIELTPRENVELGVKFGKASGFASALDEFHYWSDGKPKADVWNNAPHVHLAWGNERGLDKHPMHHQLTTRHWSDANYLTQPVFSQAGYQSQPKAQKRSDRVGIPGMIETIAASMGVDPDVAVNLASAESRFNPKAVSPVGAVGVMQMMPDTLREVAPKVGITEEQYYKDPRAQIRAGMYYFKQKLEENGGNYARALAAYNAGSGGLQKIKEGASYAETNDYVYKILKESDPSISSPEAALEAIRNGTGRTRDVKADKEALKSQLYTAKKQVTDLWSELQDTSSASVNAQAAGGTVKDYFLNPLSKESRDNPLSGSRKLTQFLNEALQDFSFGIIPMTEASRESQLAGDKILSDFANDGNYLARFAQVGTTGGVGLLRAYAGAMSGGILAKGLRVLPGIGSVLNKGDKAREALAVAGKAAGVGEAGAIAEGASLFDKVKGVITGGPMDIFAAHFSEQVAAGSIAGSSFAVSDYLWNRDDGAEGGDLLKNILIHGLGGATFGGLLSGGVALGAPLAGGVGLTALNRLTGIGSANMADNAVSAIGKEFGAMGIGQRTLAGGATGAVAGALGGAVSDVTGATQALTGEDPGLVDSVLTGAKYLGVAGAAGGAGYNKLGSVVDRVATSAFMKSSAAGKILNPIREQVLKMNDQAVRIASQEIIDTMNENMNYVKQSQAHANAFVHSASIGQTIENTSQAYQQQSNVLSKLTGEIGELQAQERQLQFMEGQVDAKYPRAAAFEMDRNQKMAQLQRMQQPGKKPNPAQQAKLAQITEDLKASQKTLSSDKDLAAEVNARNTEVARLGQFRQQWQAKMQQSSVGLKEQETTVKGIELFMQEQQQMKAHLDDLMAKGATSDELLNVRYAIQREGPWNQPKSSDPRSNLLNMEKEAITQEAELNDMLSRQSQAFIRKGQSSFQDPNLKISQQIRALSDAPPEEFQGAFQERIKAVKAMVEQIDNGRVVAPVVKGTSKGFQAWKKSAGHLTDWAADVPKDHKVVVADAESVRAGVLRALEAQGAGVERSALFAEAGQRAQARFIAKGAKVPSFDESNLLDLAKDAESMLRMGEKTLPIMVPKQNAAALETLLNRGAESSQAAAKAHAMELLSGLESSFGANFNPQGEIGALMSGFGDNQSPVQGGLADPAILDDVYRPDLSWASVSQRLSGLENGIKERLGVYGDLDSFTSFLETGNISVLPQDVRAFAVSGGDLTQAPESVKAWSEALTMTRMEEVKRLRQLEGMMLGKDDQGQMIMSQLRAAQAAGYEPPQYGMVPKGYFADLESTSTADAGANYLSSKALGEIASSDNPPVWQKIFPLAQNWYHDMVYTRMNALSIVKERMVKPAYQKIENTLIEKLKPSGKALEGVYRDFVDAVEDTGMLRAFKENHPEAEDMVNFYYGMQQHMEGIVASSPKLKPWIQANYLPHRFRKFAAHARAALPDERISLSANVSDSLKKYKNLKEVDAAVKTVTQEILDNGFSSADEFINMGMEERAKRLRFFKDPQMDDAWKALSEEGRKAAKKDAESKLMTLLLQDPVTNPLELIDMQMSSIFRADSQRRFVDGLARLPAVMDTLGKTKMMVEPVEAGNHTYKVTNPKGIEETYSKLSEIPGFAGAKLEVDGKEYSASNLQMHPEAFRFLKDFSMGSGYAENKGWRYIQRMQSIFRNSVLMGTFIPHNLNVLSGHMMDFVRAPLKMMKINIGGSNLGMGDEITQAAITANAVRNGLNVRSVDQVAGIMANQVLEEFGPNVAGRLYGIEDTTFGRFLQSLDPGDPMSKEARRLLGEKSALQRTSDILGLPAHMDYAMNREMLFKPIEMGQLAGFHIRAQRYLAENQAALSHLEPGERMRMAMRASADQCNRLAGAMPHIFQNNKLRQTMQGIALTPSWFLSKAYMIADAVDSVAHFALKGARKATGASLGGEGWTPLAAAGRRPFDYLPPAMQDATRARMAKMVLGGLIGTYAMTQTAQYFADGTLTTDHPPDKLFHIRMGDEYYTGPTVGFAKDIIRFGATWASSDGLTTSPSMESFLAATGEAITRQLNPSIESMTKVLFQSKKGEVLDYPDVMSTFLTGAAQSLGGAPLETLGIDSKQFRLGNAPGYVGLGSEEQKEAAKSSMLKSRNYLLRQVGAYSSPDNLDMKIRGVFYDRTKDLERQHRGLIKPLLEKARLADSAEEQGRWMSQAYDRYYNGVRVRDSFMRDYYPEGTYRLTEKEFESMLKEAFNPQGKATENIDGTPLGMMVAQTRALYGR